MSELHSATAAALRDAARAAAEHAYAPYSDFAVGAAVRWADGTVTTGANIENASYPLALCAERSAIVSGASAGARTILEVAVWADVPEPVTPCGGCRQVLAEFTPDPAAVQIHLGGHDRWDRVTLAELLPRPFGRRRRG